MLNLQLFFIHSNNINKFVMHLIKGLDMLKKIYIYFNLIVYYKFTFIFSYFYIEYNPRK